MAIDEPGNVKNEPESSTKIPDQPAMYHKPWLIPELAICPVPKFLDALDSQKTKSEFVMQRGILNSIWVLLICYLLIPWE